MTNTNIRIILLGSGGELDRQTIEIDEEHEPSGRLPADVSIEIIEALKCWTLAPGDTIKIEEVD